MRSPKASYCTGFSVESGGRSWLRLDMFDILGRKRELLFNQESNICSTKQSSTNSSSGNDSSKTEGGDEMLKAEPLAQIGPNEPN